MPCQASVSSDTISPVHPARPPRYPDPAVMHGIGSRRCGSEVGHTSGSRPADRMELFSTPPLRQALVMQTNRYLNFLTQEGNLVRRQTRSY